MRPAQAPSRTLARAIIGLSATTLALAGLSGTASAFCGGHGTCNRPPHVVAKAGKPKAGTGVVRIRVTFHDDHYKRIRIRVPAATSKGVITEVTRRDGSGSGTFTYTPTAAARHAAANEDAETSDQIDTFTVTVVCDPKSYLYLNGTTIDYKDEIMGSGFVFNNPNSTSTCGCGSSFSV